MDVSKNRSCSGDASVSAATWPRLSIKQTSTRKPQAMDCIPIPPDSQRAAKQSSAKQNSMPFANQTSDRPDPEVIAERPNRDCEPPREETQTRVHELTVPTQNHFIDPRPHPRPHRPLGLAVSAEVFTEIFPASFLKILRRDLNKGLTRRLHFCFDQIRCQSGVSPIPNREFR